MPGGLFGGGTSGESSTGRGGVFIPPGQGEVAGALGQLQGPLVNAAQGAPNPFNFFGTQSPYLGRALDTALNAGNYGIGQLFPQATDASSALFGAGLGALPWSNNIMGNAFNPMYGQLTQDFVNNPYFPQAMAGAQLGAGIGQQGASQLSAGAGQMLQTAFDPQNALFNRTQGQLIDQTAAANAMSGLGSSPYGASVMSNALGNFDINWQNQQLGRQQSGLASAMPAFTGASDLATLSGAGPSNVYGNYLQSILGGLDATNRAGNQGAVGLSQLLSGAGGALGQGQTLGMQGAQGLAALGGLPYSTAAQAGRDTLTGDQQLIANLMQYMGLGQSASGLANTIGSTNFNQLGQGISGLGQLAGGANSLFGGGGAGGGLFSAGGLLGSQGPLFGTAADASIAAGGPPLALSAAPLALSA